MEAMPAGARSASLTRRQLLKRGAAACAAMAGGALGGALGGCGPGSAVGRTIRFWNGFAGPDGRTMLRIINRFNEEGSGFTVAMQRTEWNTYYSKLFVAGLGKRSPEVFAIHTDQMARFARAKLLRPMDDVLAEGILPPSDFDANVLAPVTFNGRPFGVPLDTHPMGMYYNRRLLDRAGVAEPPTDRESLLECLNRVAALGASGGRAIHPFVNTWRRIEMYSMLKQWQGEVFNEDATRCTLAMEPNVAALEWCADLIHARGLAPSPENFDAWVGFRQGRVGVAWHGPFMLPDLQKKGDLDWAAAPLPRVGSRPATWSNSHVLCLRPDLEGEPLEAAVALVKFLSDHSLEWAEAGQVPVRPSLRQTAEFAAMPVQSAFAEQLPEIAYMPQVPFVQEWVDTFDHAVERALRGSVRAAVALRDAEQTVQRTVDRYLRAGWEPGRVEVPDAERI